MYDVLICASQTRVSRHLGWFVYLQFLFFRKTSYVHRRRSSMGSVPTSSSGEYGISPFFSVSVSVCLPGFDVWIGYLQLMASTGGAGSPGSSMDFLSELRRSKNISHASFRTQKLIHIAQDIHQDMKANFEQDSMVGSSCLYFFQPVLVAVAFVL